MIISLDDNTLGFYSTKHLQTTNQANELVEALSEKLKSNDEVILDFKNIETITENYTERVIRKIFSENEKDIGQWGGKKIILESDKDIYTGFEKGIESLLHYSEYKQDKESFQAKLFIVKNMLQHNRI